MHNHLKKICIVTTGQPSTNPRVVKEADALSEAGYHVHVIASHWADWADRADRELLVARRWTCQYVGGFFSSHRLRFFWTRLRHKIARIIAGNFWNVSPFAEWAVGRTSVELRRAAEATPADLYIAHYLPALVAAYFAAKKNKAKLGFDAEDFHSGQSDPSTDRSLWNLTRYIETKYIPTADYVTAGSTLIERAYRDIDSNTLPITILNVFPIASRPKNLIHNDPSDPLKLFWFSQSVGENRGIEDVVKAMGCLPREKIAFHILGQFMPGYKKKLFDLVKACNLSQTQIVLHEIINPGEVVRFSVQFDVGLALEIPHSQNRDKCLTNKIFTYLLAGNAVIATSTSAQRPLVESLGEAGWLYVPGDIFRLAEGIERWMKDRKALKKAREKAWEMGEKHYNWDLEKVKFLDIVEKVLLGK